MGKDNADSAENKKMAPKSQAPRLNKYTHWKQAGLSKPPIKVKGKMGKPQKRTGRKSVKKVGSSSVDAYEDDLSKLRGAKIREEKDSFKINMAPKSLEQSVPRGVRQIMLAQEAMTSGRSYSKKAYVSNDGERKPSSKKKRIFTKTKESLIISSSESRNMKTSKQIDNIADTRKQEKAREYRKKQLTKKRKKTDEPLKDFTEFSDLTDDIEFGEVTSRPPVNLAKPRNADHNTEKATRFMSLKLTGMLSKDSATTGTSQTKKSLHHQYVMAEERQRVVDLYRAQNSKKYKHII